MVEGIPVILTDTEDEVGSVIRTFYESEWKAGADAGDRVVPRARVAHEDMSGLGQRYIYKNEARFGRVFEGMGSSGLFLDAGCGAQPREEFGAGFGKHVCVDFSIEGLIEARRVLGDRALCVCGSLLDLPFKDGVFDGVLASHVLYHIDAGQQFTAARELTRAVGRGGRVLVFYGNPVSLERRLAGLARRVLGKKRSDMRSAARAFYFHAHPIGVMRGYLADGFGAGGLGGGRVRAVTLRLFGRRITAPLFGVPVIGGVLYLVVRVVEIALGWMPGLATYVAYVGEKD